LGGPLKNCAGRRNLRRLAQFYGEPSQDCAGHSYSIRGVENLGEASKNCAGRRKTAQAGVIYGASHSSTARRRKTVRAVLILFGAPKIWARRRRIVRAAGELRTAPEDWASRLDLERGIGIPRHSARTSAGVPLGSRSGGLSRLLGLDQPIFVLLLQLHIVGHQLRGVMVKSCREPVPDLSDLVDRRIMGPHHTFYDTPNGSTATRSSPIASSRHRPSALGIPRLPPLLRPSGIISGPPISLLGSLVLWMTSSFAAPASTT